MNRQWMLVEFQNFSRDLMVKNRANMDLTSMKTNPNQYGAEMGCNKMFFTAKFYSDGSVKFSNVGSTMMYCENNMDLETAFAKSLPTISKYKVTGHYLTLSNDAGETMKFIAADWD
ncbi:META domain-containing protein [Chryseobacterium koreense]|uniref:META domain-containing protein n=1 Tax=Chryseobacterium koreense TaxID=232216 RepID=UPI0026EFC508|nr:META domain-containing protein [Chryseobacterium koreense]